jgi:hypothetical protein
VTLGRVGLIPEDESSTGSMTTIAHAESPQYFASQIVKCDEMPTTASDIYSLGCLVLEVNIRLDLDTLSHN